MTDDLSLEAGYGGLKPKKGKKFQLTDMIKRTFSQRGHNVRKIIMILSFFSTVAFFIALAKVFATKDPKIVIILAANEGGGVQRWKTPQEWSVERSSIANKKEYAEKHGYTLTIKDVSLKRRYSHEWREGWEKADILKQTMRQYPDAEWFWWLDLYTFIMEPDVDLYEYLLDRVENKTYRTVDHFNPLKIETEIPYEETSISPVDLVLAEDCGGFNLGSFFIRKSEWSEMLLDMWWDPAWYDQKHMEWEHKEQDCLEVMYSTLPWVRDRLGFVPLRAINSFPPGACSDQKDVPRYFYNGEDRDFVVNMAGCNYGGRSCWDEYEHYRKLQRSHNVAPWWKLW